VWRDLGFRVGFALFRGWGVWLLACFPVRVGSYRSTELLFVPFVVGFVLLVPAVVFHVLVGRVTPLIFYDLGCFGYIWVFSAVYVPFVMCLGYHVFRA